MVNALFFFLFSRLVYAANCHGGVNEFEYIWSIMSAPIACDCREEEEEEANWFSLPREHDVKWSKNKFIMSGRVH